MKKVIDKASDIVNKICIAIGSCIFAVLVVSTVVQVVCRYFLHGVSVPWTEELARYCFIWASMLGSASLVKSHGHPAVDALTGKFTGKAKIIHELFVYLIIGIVAFIGIKYGFQLVSASMLQRSPALKLPQGYVYLAFPVGCICTVFHLLSGIVDSVTALSGKESKLEVI